MEKNEIGAQKMKAVLCAIYKQNQEIGRASCRERV